MSGGRDSYYAQGLAEDVVDVDNEAKDPDAAGVFAVQYPTFCIKIRASLYVWVQR